MRFHGKSIEMTRSIFLFFFLNLAHLQLRSLMWNEIHTIDRVYPAEQTCWNEQHDLWGWWGKEGRINASRTAYPPLVLPFLLRWVRGSLEANFSSSFHSFSHSSSVYTSPDYTHTHGNPDPTCTDSHPQGEIIIVNLYYFYLHLQGFLTYTWTGSVSYIVADSEYFDDS